VLITHLYLLQNGARAHYLAWAVVFAGLVAGLSPKLMAQASPRAAEPDRASRETWRKSMSRAPSLRKGCFKASYPNTEWQQVPCSTAPPYPLASPHVLTTASRAGAGPKTVGNGVDFSAQVSGLISSAEGSFPSVSGVTGEVSESLPDLFILQLSSNFFDTTVCPATSCQGWQQFLFGNDGALGAAVGMQYWLLNYGQTCPAGWTSDGSGDCYSNSMSTQVPAQTITNLAELTLTATAVSGGLDTVIVSTGSDMYSTSSEDTTLNLAQGWNVAEFNVLGGGGGGEAGFNDGSTITVKTSVESGTTNPPTCVTEGFTAESNNLTLVQPCCPEGGAFPAIEFTESNGSGATAPCTPVLSSPANGATGVSTTPTLTWSGWSGATSYNVYLGTSSSPPLVKSVSGTSYTPGTALSGGTTYYWSVAAVNSSGSTPSAVWSFTTGAAALPVPEPSSVSSGAGSGLTQAFTFTFQDPNGYADLAVTDILVNNFLNGIAACYVAFAPASASSGYLYLVDDAGDGGYAAGSPMALPGSGTLSNSQCTINGTGSSVSASGNTLTLTLSITFTSAFSGNKIVYMAARSNTQNSGWQALGTWNVPGAAAAGPAVEGMSPARTTSTGQTYSFTFTDTAGDSDLAVVDILTNDFLNGIQACYVAYAPVSGTAGYLYLVDDAGDGGYAAGSPMALPGTGTLSNSQCTVNLAGSSVSASGDTLSLNLAITFSPSFAGNQVFYAAARNNSTGNSGWQAIGSVTIP
jgi:hypothetical protein